MIKIENVGVTGWMAAIRGMRNPMNSWDKSDSCFDCCIDTRCMDLCGYSNQVETCEKWHINLGDKDLALMKKLIKAGSSERKFLRFINVTCDIVAPLYWWKEFDTYKVGTVRNSCSTMHTIAKKEFTLDDFSIEHIESLVDVDGFSLEYDDCTRVMMGDALKDGIVEVLNFNREKYLETKDKKYWWQMIQLLPSSYNQRATVQLNYEVLMKMYHERKAHKLDEWNHFCAWVKALPYMRELLNNG